MNEGCVSTWFWIDAQATPSADLSQADVEALTTRTQDGGTEVVQAKAGKVRLENCPLRASADAPLHLPSRKALDLRAACLPTGSIAVSKPSGQTRPYPDHASMAEAPLCWSKQH